MAKLFKKKIEGALKMVIFMAMLCSLFFLISQMFLKLTDMYWWKDLLAHFELLEWLVMWSLDGGHYEGVNRLI